MPYHNIIWNVKAYSSVTEVGKSIWSPPFVVKGKRFKLEVYPKGFDESTGRYVSVFLHSLSKGHSLSVGYKLFTVPNDFNIDKSKSSFISKENVSSYHVNVFDSHAGFAHGYRKFVKTSYSLLEPEAFVLGCHIGSVNRVDSNSTSTEKIPIVSILHKMYQNNEDTDVMLIVGGKEIKCHKFVLCARSKVFKAMLTNLDTTEGRTKRIEVQEFSYESMKLFIEHMYTCAFFVSEEPDSSDSESEKDSYEPEVCILEEKKNISEILLIADYYDVEDIKENCLKFLLRSNNTNDSNIFEVLKAAHRIQNTDLMFHCVSFLHEKRHLMKTGEYKTMLQQYPPLCYEVCLLLGEIGHANELIVFEDAEDL